MRGGGNVASPSGEMKLMRMDLLPGRVAFPGIREGGRVGWEKKRYNIYLKDKIGIQTCGVTTN